MLPYPRWCRRPGVASSDAAGSLSTGARRQSRRALAAVTRCHAALRRRRLCAAIGVRNSMRRRRHRASVPLPPSGSRPPRGRRGHRSSLAGMIPTYTARQVATCLRPNDRTRRCLGAPPCRSLRGPQGAAGAAGRRCSLSRPSGPNNSAGGSGTPLADGASIDASAAIAAAVLVLGASPLTPCCARQPRPRASIPHAEPATTAGLRSYRGRSSTTKREITAIQHHARILGQRGARSGWAGQSAIATSEHAPGPSPRTPLTGAETTKGPDVASGPLYSVWRSRTATARSAC
jgi:hypothetical protein